MADQNDDAEKTEQPTAKRLQDAREKGDIARSRELGMAAVTIAGAALLLIGGGPLANGLGGVFRSRLELDRADLLAPEAMQAALAEAVLGSLVHLLPLFVVTAAAAILAPLVLGGWVFSGQALAPKLARLSPIKGLGRIFGLQGLSELVKALLKFLVTGAIGGFVGWWMLSDAVALAAMPTATAIGRAAGMLALALLLMSCGLLLIAAIDAPFQSWQHHRKLKMTREEVKQEFKETDGSPEVKQRVRELQRRYSKRRMMEDVPIADVVVTNPTHFAVALKYDARRMKAPRVLAKGRDLLALEIRRIAAANGVPTFEAPPLARVLHASTEVGRDIPAGLYLAVAQVLSYVYQVKALTPTAAARLRRPEPKVAPELLAKFDRDPVTGGDS